MTARWNAALATAFASLVAIDAHAQDAIKPGEAAPGPVYRTTQLVGATVKGTQGEKLGEVKDLIVDEAGDCVAFAIVETNDAKLLPVPFVALRSTTKGGGALTMATPDLGKAPSFDAKSWPDFDHAYSKRVYDFYKAQPYWKEAAESEARIAEDPDAKAARAVRAKEKSDGGTSLRATKLIGQNVQDGHEKKIAELFDVVIDQGSGRVAYAILATGGFLGVGEQLMAVPWKALDSPADEGKPRVLDATTDQLEKAPAFDKKSWPDFTDPRIATELHRYWNQQPYWNPRTQARADSHADTSDVARHE